MFWLARPPYLRRAVGSLVTLLALWFELAPDSVVRHPYARVDLPAGRVLDASDFEMRAIPAGVLPAVGLQGILTAPIEAGDPLTPALVGGAPLIPPGWWALEVPVPGGTTAGIEVRLVVDASGMPRVVPGIVVRLLGEDTFEGHSALVAVPEAEAAAAAAAVSQGTLTVLVGSLLAETGS
ncbi:MAG: hypothetical protein Q8Q52_05125 [Acidimicrobiia bacterium]|nr:hypothetical protein [Acidimicrobiia bacterium]